MRRCPIIYGALFLFGLGLMAALFPPIVTAQEVVSPARKFDEFSGPLGTCDLGARLDNFAIELQNNTDVNGFIIVYGPEGVEPGSGIVPLEIAKEYLENTRGINATRIKSVYGGRSNKLDESFTELWIIPPGASLPEPVSFENDVKTFQGKFAEYEYWEGTAEGEGISHGNVMQGGLADVLRQQPESRVYIVVWNDKEAPPGAWQRAANDVTASLKNDYKIDAERIKVICAGYDADSEDESVNARVQLWVLPKDAPPPIEEAKGPEPTPEKAVRWRSFWVYELADEADRHDLFEAFADVLRSNKNLSICIITHQQGAPEQDAEPILWVNGKDNPPDAELELKQSEAIDENKGDEDINVHVMERGSQQISINGHTLPTVDLTQLAGKWQSDLASEYGINQQRLTILTGAGEDWDSGMMEIWFVPIGAPLPDLNAETSVAEDEEIDTSAPEGTQAESSEAEPQKLR